VHKRNPYPVATKSAGTSSHKSLDGGSGIHRSSKRLLDVVGALVLLIFLAPLFLGILLAILAESGRPAFSRRRCIGQYGHEFNLLTFRSSTTAARDNNALTAVRTRTTYIGRLVVLAGLEHLPQLFNVLSGEMSLVGPRPFSKPDDEYYAKKISNYAVRYQVKPGLFGWTELEGITGENPTLELIKRRVQFDNWYIANISLGLDLKILLRTLWDILRGRP